MVCAGRSAQFAPVAAVGKVGFADAGGGVVGEGAHGERRVVALGDEDVELARGQRRSEPEKRGK